MLILASLILISTLFSIPISTIKTDFDIIQISQAIGSQFYIVTPSGIILYDINSRSIRQEYRSNSGTIVGKGYLDMPRRAVLPTTNGIVEYTVVNMVINQRYINVPADQIYFSNNHFYTIVKKERSTREINILDNQLNLLSNLKISGEILDVYAGSKYFLVHSDSGIYIMIGNTTIQITDLKPSAKLWYGIDRIYIPFYQQLYVIDLYGNVLEQRYFNTSIYAVFQVDRDYHAYTIDGIYTSSKIIDIQPPLINSRYYLNDEMVLVNSGRSTYLILNGIPVGSYEFEISNNILYLPNQRVFLVANGNLISIYSAASCYFNRRYYVDYCRDIKISGNFYISQPIIILKNQTLQGNILEGINIRWGSLPPDTYELRCISDYQGDYSIGQSDNVELVILAQGLKNNFITKATYNDIPIEQYYIVPENSLIRFEIRDYKNLSAAANMEIIRYDTGEVVQNLSISGVRAVEFNTSGDYVVRFVAQCYNPAEYYIRVTRQGSILDLILPILGVLVLGLLVYVIVARK
ncbi:MAG: hypothetical protein QW336_00045 [Candidatus Anstonellales archaeon]